MITTKQRRDRLFKKSRPLVRPFDPKTDMWVLWAAYDLGSFPNMKKGMTREELKALVIALCNVRSSCLVIEDDCKHFKAGRGPVAFVIVDNFGWRIEPKADYFRWATPRIILRCNVAFFQMVRWRKDVGVCVIRSLEKTANLFRKIRKYGLIEECGVIPNGDPNGDEYLFVVKHSKYAPLAMKQAA